MGLTVTDRARRSDRASDQAAGLRRLFAPAAARLLPVLAGGAGRGETPWLARLGEAFARAGQQTLLVDASRAQVAAVLGLRARFDLQHALDGDCSFADVPLDAAPGLTVVPAARACERAAPAGAGLATLLSPYLAAGVDVVLLLLPASRAHLLDASEVLVPVLPTRESIVAAAAQIGEASGRQGSLAFRLLFLGMEKAAAVTLGKRMSESIGSRFNTAVRHGAVAPLPRDLARVVAATSALALTRVATGERPVESGETR